LHKTFSAPHSSIGQGAAAVCVKAKLARFLPAPVVTFDGERYGLEAARPDAIDKIRGFLGNVQTVLKAYAWTMSLGAEGLRAVAETAVLNSNYLLARLRTLRGIDTSRGRPTPATGWSRCATAWRACSRKPACPRLRRNGA
jgi:glycine dehydrogenase subunit 2